MARKPKQPSSGPSKFIAFIGDDGAILVHMRGQNVVRRMYAPSPDDEYTEGFKEYLSRDTEAPVYLLIDVMDQTYTAQTLPPVTKLSVGKLIKRRMERDFAPDDIKGAIPLGREKSGRKDWNYLLIALSPTPQLNKWIGLFSELPNRLNGIYLAPVEAERYIQELAEAVSAQGKRDASRWRFMVSHNKVGGFRQIVTRDGKLLFTRLAQPIGESVPEVIAGNIEQEILNTVEYLKRLGYREEDGLDLMVIVSEEIKSAIDSAHFNLKQIFLLTPYEVNDLLKLKKAALPEDHYGDVIMTAFFGAANKHKLRLQTKYTQALNQYYVYRAAIRAAAAALLAVFLLYTGYGAYLTLPLLGEFEDLEHKKVTLNKKIASLREDSKTLPDDIDRITDVVSVYESYAIQDHSPLNYIADFSSAMEGDALLNSVSWSKKNPMLPGGEKKQEVVSMKMDVAFRMKTGRIDAFLEHANHFLERVRATFKDYKVENSKLPGMLGDNEIYQATFGDSAAPESSNMLSGQPVVIQLSIDGPNPLEETIAK